MAFKCPNCKTPIEATPDMKIVVCPQCGKKYKNPKYVEPAPAEPEAPSAPAYEEPAQDSYAPSYEEPAQETYSYEQPSYQQDTYVPEAPAYEAQPEYAPAAQPAEQYAPEAYAAPAQPDQAPQAAPAPAPVPESEFTGSMISWLGHHLFNFFITLITLGIGYPWAIARRYRWEIGHKVIDGRKLTFDGKGSQLLGNWIKWVLLTIITIGIYGLWVPCKLQKWITKHTHFAD